MHKEHDISQGDGDNEKNWNAIGENRWKTSPAGGEISYYEDKDQHEFLNPHQAMPKTRNHQYRCRYGSSSNQT